MLVLSPAAPHTSDEIWEQLGGQDSTYHLDWPKFQAELAQDDTITMAIQVNGKLRDTLEMPADASQEAMQEAALSSERVKVHTEGKTVRKVIVIPGKLVNIVAN